MEHLHVPCDCHKARKISDDLKWNKHLPGTHDDHLGVQAASAIHHARDDKVRMDIAREVGKMPGRNVNLRKEVKKYNSR